jgi:hypothetical protein
VPPDELPLVGGEIGRLVKDLVRDAHLADIVELGSSEKLVERLAVAAPFAVMLLGLDGTFVLTGAAVLAYAGPLARPHRTSEPATAGLALSPDTGAA